MSVFSKIIDKTSARYGIRQEQLTRGVVGIVTTLYLLKIGYPHIIASVNKARRNCDDDSVVDEKTKSSDYNENNENYDDNEDPDSTTKRRENNENNLSSVETRNNKLSVDKDILATKLLSADGTAAGLVNLGLDKNFLKQLVNLLKIMVPGWRTREAGLLTCATVTLLARTFLSVYVATLEGQIVKRIVLKDVRGFFHMLGRWFAIALPATFVNSAIRYLEGRLALSFRERLVKHSYKMYLSQQTYYRVSALDTRLGGAEQRLTDDLSELASSVAHLYSSLTKPLLDCALVGIALVSFSSRMGAKTIPGPLLAAVVIAATGQVLRLASPRFGQLVAEEASRRGRLREAHARISAHSEEIAFYGGHEAEHRYLSTAYRSLVVHLRKVLALKLWYVMLEQLLMKYVWSGTGLIVIAMPLLYNTAQNLSSSAFRDNDGDGGVSERTRYLTTSKNLLSSGADAVERLMSSYKELVALAGYANRVSEMLDVFKDAALCKYRRNVVVSHQSRIVNGTLPSSRDSSVLEFHDGTPIIKGIVRESLDGSISLSNVPIVTPNCEVIVSSLTLDIKPGDHLLITGANGCGKSSLFRIISGLWPIYGGTLTRPAETYAIRSGRPAMFYIPQKPYMTIGCLRDQITYPAECKKGNSSDEKLLDLLGLVDLRGLAERDNDGLDAHGDWDSILSGGEKQRLAMTRLYYHAPQYALLDECTSAVSLEAEGSMYETAKKRGITLLTITHRVSSLAKFHRFLLRFDGEGGWKFGLLSNENDALPKTDVNEDKQDIDGKERHYRLQEFRDMRSEDTHIGIS